MIRTTTASDEETQDRAAALAAVLAPGDIVVLSGTLGAGKTTFVKGVARGLGVRERVTSPTFVLVRQHDCVNGRGITTLHHADVYRVGDLDEVWDLALGELVEESGVALVEWGELATAAWGPDHSTIDVVTGPDETRTWTVAGPLATRAPRPEGWEPC